ncbi:MAG: hypothetical protein E6I75_00620 [Chloroflexi bacterium]|nr:MAG: hypothetical protein E6I75_00620 [Chloroflexota bacterium]
MRIRRFGRLLGAAALLAVVALPGTVSAQGGLPGGGGGGGGGGIAVPGIVLGGGGGGGGGGGLLLNLAFAPNPAFPLASASLGVSTARADLTLNTTGLPQGSLVCLKENATTLVACAVIDPFTGVAAFPHLALTSISLVPGSTFSIVQGLAGATIASATLP